MFDNNYPPPNRQPPNLLYMDTELNNYIQSLSEEYGKATNLIWISKKRKKYILEFAYTRILIINDEKYNFKDILSCRIEEAPYPYTEEGNPSRPYILLIGTNNRTNILISLTVWSKSIATKIESLMQNIIQSNNKLQ